MLLESFCPGTHIAAFCILYQVFLIKVNVLKKVKGEKLEKEQTGNPVLFCRMLIRTGKVLLLPGYNFVSTPEVGMGELHPLFKIPARRYEGGGSVSEYHHERQRYFNNSNNYEARSPL